MWIWAVTVPADVISTEEYAQFSVQRRTSFNLYVNIIGCQMHCNNNIKWNMLHLLCLCSSAIYSNSCRYGSLGTAFRSINISCRRWIFQWPRSQFNHMEITRKPYDERRDIFKGYLRLLFAKWWKHLHSSHSVVVSSLRYCDASIGSRLVVDHYWCEGYEKYACFENS